MNYLRNAVRSACFGLRPYGLLLLFGPLLCVVLLGLGLWAGIRLKANGELQ